MKTKLSRSLCLLLSLLLLNVLPVVAQNTAQTAGSVPKISFEQYKLPNGLQVILHVDKKLPIVHVNQWFHVGSKNERLGRTGFAHLFEHIMFQGSKNATGEYFSFVEKLGANDANGTTNNDRTNYFATVPSGNLEYLLWVESDRLATLADALTKEKLDNQRDVVRNERRQSYENQPYGRAFKLLFENVFPTGHPYSWPVIGSHEDLIAASLEDVKDFFRTYYSPNNLSLVIAGDFDPAEAKRLVEKYFGNIPAGPALDRPTWWVPKLDGEKVVEVSDRVPQERVYMAWPTPPFYRAGDAELDLTGSILSDGLSARLNKILVYDKQLATDVSAFQVSMEIASMFAVVATARPGASLAQIEQTITEEIARLARTGPTVEELNRAKIKWEFQFVTGLERIGGFGGKADRLNQYFTFWGDPGKFDEDLARYRNATVEGVRDTVAKWINTPNRVLVRFRPETSGRESQAALDRAKPPQVGVDRAFNAPEVKSAKLDNGMEIFVVERPELPKVSIMLATRAGSVADPASKEGTANLLVNTMDRGTKTRKALEIEDALGDLGTAFVGSAGRESVTVSMEVLKRNLSPAMTIFSDVVLNPTFPEAEVERERKLHLDTLAQQERDANALASRIRPMLTYGPDHPYGRPHFGLPRTVEQITRADLARFYETNWKPASSALIFVGDISMAEATEMARQNFGGWQGGAAPAVAIPEPRPFGPGKVFLVDRQDAAQTVILEIMSGPPRKTDDYYALRLADTVWGGVFGSRLNLNLREDKGYSYGVFSNQAFLSRAGVWWAQGGVQTNKTKESLTEFISELKFLAGQKPISETELADAKANRLRGYAMQFESLGDISGQIALLWVAGMPMTELQREPTETQKMTLAQVNAAAQKYAVPGKTTLLLIGDVSKFQTGIKELNAGEIVILDVEGKPKK
jgi:Predicted Zn-dependent peptidases